MAEEKQVVIIEAGPGGLASAILLANAGAKVKVVERLPFLSRTAKGLQSSAV